MSSAPDSSRMPYELAVEEVQLYVSPLLDLGNAKPRNRKWLKRWVLSNAELIEFNGANPIIVTGLRRPFDTQAEIRRQLPPQVDGLMPRYLGDFTVRDTRFIVTHLPKGKPAENSIALPEIAIALIRLDTAFRKFWSDKNLPGGISKTTLSTESLEKAANRLQKSIGESLHMLAGKLAELPLDKLEQYPVGLIHGDPGIDNAFVCETGVVFTDGPGEFGPEIVDIAYLMQSAAATLEDFDPIPTIETLADHYNKSVEAFSDDLLLADIAAHINVIAWFDRCGDELIPDYVELYDHLIEDRVKALETLVENTNPI